jgi:hypothetical protein
VCRDSHRHRSVLYSYAEWEADHADHLLDMWHGLKEHVSENGLVMLDDCRFDDFVEFCTRHTELRYNPYVARSGRRKPR